MVKYLRRSENMKRSDSRENAMIAVYQYLLVNRDINELLTDAFETELDDIDPYFVAVAKNSVEHENEYKDYINNVLTDWTYDRLGTIERAILLNGCSEFALKQVAAAVIIDESVELAKKYCDEDTYKLINSVLDII